MKGFNSLELFFKKDFVKRSTNFIISTTHLNYTVKLYWWNEFFFEQYFDHTSGAITVVKQANKGDLEKYLKEIDISALGVTARL